MQALFFICYNKNNFMISGKTKIFGIFGYPIEHTLSPLMHNSAFEYLGLDCIYLPFEVKPSDLRDAIQGMKGLNIRGINVTIPHKEEVIKYLDEVEEEGRLIGAVNTILNNQGRLIGTNTDGLGFLYALKNDLGISPSAKRIFMLGAGGAARAILVSLAKDGAKRIVVANRSLDKGKKLINQYREIFRSTEFIAIPLEDGVISEYLRESDIFINATPVGMKNINVELSIPLEVLSRDSVIFDTVYNPEEPIFILRAKSLGLRCANGLGMLCYQGALSFELWTGEKAPLPLMMSVLKKHFERGD
jgi:shikimate dehydrogenase